jgi:hypothetical protein
MTLAVPAVWAVVRLADAGLPSTQGFTFHGVRLGMTPADVRSRFDVSAGLRASVAEDGTYLLDLENAAGTVRAARLEFHEGLLVAIRAELDPRDEWASDDGLFLSEATVRRTLRDGTGNTQLTVLSRTCPTHADEVRALMASAAPRH